MSTVIHNVTYSPSGGSQHQHQQAPGAVPTSAGASGVPMAPSAGGVGEGVGYNVGEAMFGDGGGCGGGGGGGNYISVAYQHPMQMQQPHQHQHHLHQQHPQVQQHHQQVLMKPGDQSLGYPDMHQHQHQHWGVQAGQHLQLPLTEPLLQQCQQQVDMAITDYVRGNSPELLTMCQDGGSGGGGGAVVGSVGGKSSKKRRKAPTTSTGRRSLKSEKVNPEESHRREKRRERNRVAAAKCRQKRQNRIECLSETVRDLEAGNASLEADVSWLIDRRGQLICEARAHQLNCPNTDELADVTAAVESQPVPQLPQPLRTMSCAAGSGGNSTDGFEDEDDREEEEGEDDQSESCPSSSSRGAGGGGLDSSFNSGALGGVSAMQPTSGHDGSSGFLRL